MTGGPEYNLVERPFIEQLTSMGWSYVTGDADDPAVTQRESFRDVLLQDDLRQALRRITLNEQGDEWLDDGRIAQAVNALDRISADKLLEANERATELLLKGTVVDGVPGWDQGRGRTVHYIDWDNVDNNTFRVVNQFRVDEPGGQANKYILPDLVLFVNGIPLVVVECKSPQIAEPIAQAIDQLQRYANQRERYEQAEGNERLFYTIQFVIATSYDRARVGTFTSQAVHFLEWKDTSPLATADVAAALGKDSLSGQETLVAGMLTPAHLLDIVRHFTLFMDIGNRTVKIVTRYQQFRAVQRAVERMLTGKTRREDGEYDGRGGIVWHTQGSGKSLTMVFLVRKMRSIAQLRPFKVVFVTDRKDLQKQLSDTAKLTDESLTIVAARTEGGRTIPAADVLQETLARPGKDLVFTMIQNYQRDQDGEGETDGGRDEFSFAKPFPVLNESESIFIMVDEAHRSHGNELHANLLRALPNCVRIGFTGTPIIMGAKKRTHEIFGEFIDRYTIRESEDDGMTVPILYEGRTARGAVKGGGDLDDLFEDMFADRSEEELEAIRRKYATKGNVLESHNMIKAKARDMLRHYVEAILPNGFKAQVVAVSRRAAVRYYEAFKEARDELVQAIEKRFPYTEHFTDDEIQGLDPETAFLVRAQHYLPHLRILEFAPVISAGTNDDPDWKEWTQRGKIDDRIARFKRPFPDNPQQYDETKYDPLSFLIVKSMLLTGFDAPVEQAMYLDRHIKEAELLQAIARVNRTNGDKKMAGIVVDYYGVAHHLQEALAAYAPEDVEGMFQSLKDEIPKLRDQHRRAIDVFRGRGVDIGDREACVELLRDERLRAEFHVKLKHFLGTLDLVLPRPEALDFTDDAKRLGEIQARARNRYRGGEPLIGEDVGDKVRKLIDDHLETYGINPTMPPIEITSAEFPEHVARERSPRAQASEMEHALRYHIRKQFGTDPVFYERLSRRLEKLLHEMEGQWEALLQELWILRADAMAGRGEDDTGLNPETEAPFYDLLLREALGAAADAMDIGTPSEKLHTQLVKLTVEMVAHIGQEIRAVDFWSNPHRQTVLRNWIIQFLDDANGVIPFDRLEHMADLLLELAKSNHTRLTA